MLRGPKWLSFRIWHEKRASGWQLQAWEAVGVELTELRQLRSSVAAVLWNHRVQLLLAAIQQCQQPSRTGPSLPSQEHHGSAGSLAAGVPLHQEAAEVNRSPCTPSTSAAALLIHTGSVKASKTEPSQASHQTTQTLPHLDSCASPGALPAPRSSAPGQTRPPAVVSLLEKQSPPGGQPDSLQEHAAIIATVVSQPPQQPNAQSDCRTKQSNIAAGAAQDHSSVVDGQLSPGGGATGLGHLRAANTEAAANLDAGGAAAEASIPFRSTPSSNSLGPRPLTVSWQAADRNRLGWQCGNVLR